MPIPRERAVSQKRFVQLTDVAEILDISMSQAQALVRRGDLRALKVGGRGQWRIELTELDAYIERCYAEAARHVRDGQEAGQGAVDS